MEETKSITSYNTDNDYTSDIGVASDIVGMANNDINNEGTSKSIEVTNKDTGEITTEPLRVNAEPIRVDSEPLRVDADPKLSKAEATDDTPVIPTTFDANAALRNALKTQGLDKKQNLSDGKKLRTNDSAGRLEELNFDPIEQLIARYHAISEIIDDALSKGGRNSLMGLSSLISIQTKIASDLMKYGYNVVAARDAPDPTKDEAVEIILMD